MKRAVLLLMCMGCEAGEVDGPAPESRTLPTITTASGVEMVLLPAGEFTMGSAKGKDDERPPHLVKVEAFYMDRTEVTQGELDRLKVPNPSKFKGASNPVELMPWT